MSTDTTHKMTFKGGDTKSRLAAANYVYILSKPWQEEWEETRRSIKVRVFRNESNCSELFAPEQLCAKAAELFPGVEIEWRSDNEYGEKESYSWCEGGEPAADPLEKAAGAILSEVLEKREGSRRYQWLAELAQWVEEVGLGGQSLRRIKRAWRQVQELKAREETDATNRLKQTILRQLVGEDELGRRAVWSFGWYDLLPSTSLGITGKPFIDYHNQAENSIGDACMPIRIRAKNGVVLEEPSSPSVSSRQVKIRKEGNQGHFGLHDGKVVRRLLSPQLDKRSRRNCVTYQRYFDHNGVVAMQNLRNAKWLIRGEALGATPEVRYFEQSIEDLRDNIQRPVISGEYVYTLFHALYGSEARLVALHRDTGQAAWQQPVCTGDPRTCGGWTDRCQLGVTLDGDPLVTSHAGGVSTLTRFSSSDGSRLWGVSVKTDQPFVTMAIRRDSVLTVMMVPQDALGEAVVAELACFAVSDGRLLWRVCDDQIAADAKLLSIGEHTYVCDSRRLLAFGPLGESLWAVKMPEAAEGAVQGVSVGAAGVILVSLYRQAVHAFSPVNGDLLWTMRAKVESEVTVGARGIGYFCASDAVVSVDTRTGAQVWRSVRAEDGELALAEKAPVAMNERRILVRMKRGVQLVDAANGREVGWMELPVDCWNAGDMVADKGRLFVTGEPECETTRLFCLSHGGLRPAGPWPMKGRDGRASRCLPSDVLATDAPRRGAVRGPS